MNDDTPRPPGTTLSLRELCERVRLRLVEEYEKDQLFNPFPDPPVDCYAASVFVLISEFVVYLGGVVALIALAFSTTTAIIAAVFAGVVLAARIYARRRIIGPRQRFMQACHVRPAVVAQAYGGGFVPPEDDPDTPSFTGVVVFSFDPAVTGEQLQTMAQSCMNVKRGDDVGELADLKQMLLTGDDEFVRSSFRWPESIAGNQQTFAAPILFVREFDLVDGYLSTDIQLIFVHPERPDHPCPVPPEFWAAAQSLALLRIEAEAE